MNAAPAAPSMAPPLPLWRRPAYRAVWKAQRALCSRVFLDLGGDHGNTLYVAGGSRSGTTWLAELLNHRNEYRYIFEPLTPPQVTRLRGFPRGLYLRPGFSDGRYRDPMREVLSGRVRDAWADRYNRTPVARQRLIKDVYANLLLPWIREQFPGMPMVLIARHPCAVINSRLALQPYDSRLNFDADLDRYTRQDALVEDHLSPFLDLFRSARTPVEQQALWWCVETYVPLRALGPQAVHVVLYERLRSDPQRELRALAAHLGRRFDSRIVRHLSRRSLMTGPFSALQRGGDPSSAWRGRLAADDVRSVLRILARFGLDAIYTDSAMPDPRGVTALREMACAS